MSFIGCKEPVKEWRFKRELKLKNVHPIGGVVLNNEVWLSDGDGNRVVKINKHGEILDEISNLERPMHIDGFSNTLLIPEYGKDIITLYTSKAPDSLKGMPELDGPAGISKFKNELAIADFYNNVVHYYNGEKLIKIGGKGSGLGEFNYPTDVQITTDAIYVADAYNHRVQVFDKEGRLEEVFAGNQNINAATGLFVEQEVYVTDFENDRILVFSMKNELLQIIDSNLFKPTDVFLFEEELYVLNYRSGSISVFEKT